MDAHSGNPGESSPWGTFGGKPSGGSAVNKPPVRALSEPPKPTELLDTMGLPVRDGVAPAGVFHTEGGRVVDALEILTYNQLKHEFDNGRDIYVFTEKYFYLIEGLRSPADSRADDRWSGAIGGFLSQAVVKMYRISHYGPSGFPFSPVNSFLLPLDSIPVGDLSPHSDITQGTLIRECEYLMHAPPSFVRGAIDVGSLKIQAILVVAKATFQPEEPPPSKAATVIKLPADLSAYPEISPRRKPTPLPPRRLSPR